MFTYGYSPDVHVYYCLLFFTTNGVYVYTKDEYVYPVTTAGMWVDTYNPLVQYARYNHPVGRNYMTCTI